MGSSRSTTAPQSVSGERYAADSSEAQPFSVPQSSQSIISLQPGCSGRPCRRFAPSMISLQARLNLILSQHFSDGLARGKPEKSKSLPLPFDRVRTRSPPCLTVPSGMRLRSLAPSCKTQNKTAKHQRNRPDSQRSKVRDPCLSHPYLVFVDFGSVWFSKAFPHEKAISRQGGCGMYACQLSAKHWAQPSEV